MKNIPDPNVVFPNTYKTSCFLKNVVSSPNVFIGDYTYYDDPEDPTGFEQNNILFHYPEFGDRLVIGKFCSIASGTKFIMGAANHRLSSVTTYPFPRLRRELGRNIRLPIWNSCPERETPLWETTCGSAGSP